MTHGQPLPHDASLRGLRDYIETILADDHKLHDETHRVEHSVAKETALRLEHQVQDEANRIDRAVDTALAAVADTARIHTDAHQQEHNAHERIHAVEKEQVDKEEIRKRDEAIRIAMELKEYKGLANEWRGTVTDVTSRFVGREMFEAYQKEREIRLQSQIDRIIALEKSQVSGDAVDAIRDEQRRTRVGFYAAVGLLALGVLVNLAVNLAQSGAHP